MNTTYAVGDLVVPNPDAGWSRSVLGKTYRITKTPVGARGVNYLAEPVDGGRGLRAPAEGLLPASEGTAVVTTVPLPDYVPLPPVGTVVTVRGVRQIDPADLYVVTAPSRKDGCVRLSRLGGTDGDRYWPSIPVRMCTTVPLNEIGSHPVNTTITTASGRTRALPPQMDPTRVVGLDPEGRIVVDDFGALAKPVLGGGHTLCCDASDKGVEDGVVCRGCYGYDEVGDYLYREVDGTFPGLDPVVAP